MRKISYEASHSLINGNKYTSGNTRVYKMGTDSILSLHGNDIARVDGSNGQLEITACGWFTATTKERLNALPGVHIQQKAGTWYLNGNVWDGRWTLIDTNK